MEHESNDSEMAPPTQVLTTDEGSQGNWDAMVVSHSNQADSDDESKNEGLLLEMNAPKEATEATEMCTLSASMSVDGPLFSSKGGGDNRHLPFVNDFHGGAGPSQLSRPPSPPVQELAMHNLPKEAEGAHGQECEDSTGSSTHVESGSLEGVPPVPFSTLLTKALHNATSLDSCELEMLAQGTFNKATETAAHGAPAAKVCVHVIRRVAGDAFLQFLLQACHEGLAKRVQQAPEMREETRRLRWLPYINFLAQLLALLEMVNGVGRAGVGDSVQQLAKLLCICCRTVLNSQWLHKYETVICLRTALSIAGKHMEAKDPEQMQMFLVALRECYGRTDLPASLRDALFELLQYHASGWRTARLERE